MSKRPQEFGAAPLKIRVEGEDGFRPAQRIEMERLGGAISKFHAACVQQVKISEQPGYKKNIALPGGTQLRYSYNNGQETMDIRYSPRETPVEEKKDEPTERTPWDWLVVDIELPTYNSAMRGAGRYMIQRMTAAARFYSPALADIPDPGNPPTESNPNPPPLFDSLERLAIDRQFGGSSQQEPGSPPRLLWGLSTSAEQVGADDIPGDPNTIHRCSLLVDIRQFAAYDIIEFDIWGQLDLRELDKTLHTVVNKSWVNSDEPVRIKGRYTGGPSGRAWFESTFPSIAATVTNWFSHNLSYLQNYYIPAGLSSGDDDSILTDVSHYSPEAFADNSADFENWYFNNQDIFNNPLWDAGFSAQWADVDPPYGGWATGSWTSGADMSYYLSGLDAAPMPSDQSFTGMLSELGKQVFSISGSEFWWQWETYLPGSGTDGFDYGGNGDPGTPPPNNYGESGSFAVGFAFGAVRNTYVFKPRIQTVQNTPEHREEVSFKVKALRGNYITAPEGASNTDPQLVWSERKPDYNDLFVALDPATSNVWRYGQWEEKGKYPDRWTMAELDKAQAVPVTDEYVTENSAVDNAKYLGRITFDQTGGGSSFSWTPADNIPPDKLPQMPA